MDKIGHGQDKTLAYELWFCSVMLQAKKLSIWHHMIMIDIFTKYILPIKYLR